MTRNGLTALEVEVLSVLVGAGTGGLGGLEICEKSDGISKGSIYMLLHKLERKGLVSSRVEAPSGHRGRPKRSYKITANGRRVYKYGAQLIRSLKLSSEV